MPMGPSPNYPVKYNNYTLKGYVQSESDSSPMNVASHDAAYFDGGLSEYTGLSNKVIPLKFKLWEPTWADCKTQYNISASYLRSKRDGWTNLYINDTDRHYYAMTKTISREKAVGSSMRTLEYSVEFEARPFLERDIALTISGGGTGTITTATVGRTIDTNGGWSPCTVKITGSNVTVSGYSVDTNAFTGYISEAGAVTGLVVDTDNYTAKIGSTNANDKMTFVDYQMWVAPGETNFVIGGTVTSVEITWHDRWY